VSVSEHVHTSAVIKYIHSLLITSFVTNYPLGTCTSHISSNSSACIVHFEYGSSK